MSNKIFTIPEQMQAIEIKEFGAPENLHLCFRSVPNLSDNQVLIKVSFAGVNRPDLLQRQGNYKVPDTASDLPGLDNFIAMADKYAHLGEIYQVTDGMRAMAKAGQSYFTTDVKTA